MLIIIIFKYVIIIIIMDTIIESESDIPINDGVVTNVTNVNNVTDIPINDGTVPDIPIIPINDGPVPDIPIIPINDGPVPDIPIIPIIPINDGTVPDIPIIPINDDPVPDIPDIPINDDHVPVISDLDHIKLKNDWKTWRDDANNITKQMDFLSNFDVCDMLDKNIIPIEITNSLNKAIKIFNNDKKIEILNLNTDLDKKKYINNIINKILLIGNLGFIIKCKIPNTSTPDAINEYLENLILNTICDFNNGNPVIKIKGILPGSQKLHKDNIHYTINERNDVIRSTLIAIYVKNILNPLTGGKNINIKIKTIKKYKKSKKITRRRRNR